MKKRGLVRIPRTLIKRKSAPKVQISEPINRQFKHYEELIMYQESLIEAFYSEADEETKKKLLEKLKAQGKAMNLTLFCEANLLSRQNLYKTYIHCDVDKLEHRDRIKDEVFSILADHPGLSGKQIRKELADKGIHIGRDSFYRLVNHYKLTLNSRKKAWKRV